MSENQKSMKQTTLYDTDLPYYDHKEKELRGTQTTKAKKFIKLKRVQRKSSNKWTVMFIPGYNTRNYDIILDNGKFSCNCQWNVTKKLICSHIIAVLMYQKVISVE